jgi:sulfur carrier protein
MQICVNGHPQDVPDLISVADLLVNMSIEKKRIAIELNQEIIPRGKHSETLLKEGDEIEVIHAIAGG